MQNNDIKNELSTNFIEYAVAVNTDRAIPDAKSGLKPVARRILWSAYEEGRVYSKPHIKSARIVGDVMGKLHPHGDSSIYGALVRLSQPWVLRYPLIDWHGSNGNISGDGPAASRYTEARLSKLSEDGLLFGLKKKNVDFTLNYDETLYEPVTLPAIFPNLLCNPNTGIGVAMACNWLPHNLKEVAAAINDYIDGKEPMLPGPDFPTGGIIINKNDIPGIMRTGHGSVKVRGRYKIEKNCIVFYEIPYGVTTESILTEIAAVCDAKEIEDIEDIRNESNKKGMRLVIECDKSANLESIVQKLFEKTDLQSSISYNQIALVDKTPCELNLKDACKIYVDHNISCIVREAEFDLKKAKDRLHIVEGLLKALEDIDNIIALIKKSDNSSAAKDNLMNKYEFTEVQAKAILAMRLSSLAHLEKVEIENEKADLEKNIKELDMLISDDLLQIKELRARLSSIVNKYGDDRRTELTHIEIKKTKEEKPVEEIIPEDVVVVTTKSGLIKRIPADSFKPTKRGKVGTKNIDDVILDIVKTNTVDKMIFFTTKGKMYQLSVEKIGAGTATSKGSHISTFVKMDDDETVIAVTSMNRVNPKKYIIFTTKNGMIKKSCISEYMGSHRNGILALNIKENDEVVSIDFADEENMMLVTKNGMSIQVETKDINPVGRVAMGVKGIKLDDNDEVVESLIVKDKGYIIIVSSDGLGKRVKIGDFPIQGRNGKGVTVYKGEVAGAAFIENAESETILITGNYSNLCILAKDFPEVSRAAAGNIIIKNNKVINITKL